MRWLGVVVPIFVLLAAPAVRAAPPETHSFALYKWQQRIGREDVTVTRDADGVEIRTVFAFTDRTTPVPLAAVLRVGSDGAPRHFVLWGSTSRLTRVDDRVVVSGKDLVITQRGESRTVPAPATFFVGSAYAPVAVTEELLRYWTTHGKPPRLPVFPVGEVTIERRGEDVVTDDESKQRTLERFAIGGLQWGHETVWLDEKGALAALKGVDAEFDHFEATGRGFTEALAGLVARAAEDGMASLSEAAAQVRQGASSGKTAYVGARLIDGTGRPPVEDAVVLVEGYHIVAAGARAKVAIPDGARTTRTSSRSSGVRCISPPGSRPSATAATSWSSSARSVTPSPPDAASGRAFSSPASSTVRARAASARIACAPRKRFPGSSPDSRRPAATRSRSTRASTRGSSRRWPALPTPPACR
jgi:hypothetical protein